MGEGHQDAAEGRADEADCETARTERGPNAAKRAGQHHAVELYINDAGLFRDELAEGREYQRRGEGDRGREEEDRCGNVHGQLLTADCSADRASRRREMISARPSAARR